MTVNTERFNEDTTMNTTPEDGDTASRKQSVTGSDDNSFYDSYENPTGSPVDEIQDKYCYKLLK